MVSNTFFFVIVIPDSGFLSNIASMKKAILLCAIAAFIFACGGNEKPGSTSKRKTTANKVSGEKVFNMYCVQCHGKKGDLKLNGATDLTLSELPLEERIDVIANGRNTMLPYKGVLKLKEIAAVAGYLEELKEKNE